jgi:CRISPR-associated endonuclease Cas2
MRKLLKLNEILLLGLGGLLDIFGEIRDPANLFSNYYQSFYGFVPERWKKKNYRELIRNSLKTGLIEKIEKEGKPYLQLSRKGEIKIKKRLPLLVCQKQNWDGELRLVVFDIAEVERVKRNWLRDRLKIFGFAMLQKSVWVSPYDFLIDIKEFFEEVGISEKVVFLETNKIIIGDIKEFANKLWKLETINENYRAIFEETEQLKKNLQANFKKQELLEIFKQLYQRFIALILKDPFLPKEFLASDWLYEKTWENISQLKKELMKIKKTKI